MIFLAEHPEQYVPCTSMENYFQVHNLLNGKGEIDSQIWERFREYVVLVSHYMKEAEGRSI